MRFEGPYAICINEDKGIVDSLMLFNISSVPDAVRQVLASLPLRYLVLLNFCQNTVSYLF